MAPIQRDGIEYEFTTVFDLSQNHTATVSKDRTKLFDGQYFTPTADCGKALLRWLNAGNVPQVSSAPQKATPIKAETQSVSGKQKTHRDRLERIWKQLGWDKTQPLDAYMTSRMQSIYGEGATVDKAQEADWESADREITNYLIEQKQNKIAEVLPGEPDLEKDEIPF